MGLGVSMDIHTVKSCLRSCLKDSHRKLGTLFSKDLLKLLETCMLDGQGDNELGCGGTDIVEVTQ